MPDAEKDALWVDASREVAEPINEAMRVLEQAIDDFTREATWRHIVDQSGAIFTAAAQLVNVVGKANLTCVLPPGGGDTGE